LPIIASDFISKQKVVDRNHLYDKRGVLYTELAHKPFTGIILTYHVNGQLQSISECIKGKLFGLGVILNKEEKIRNRAYYVRETVDGNIVRWLEDVKSRKMGAVIKENELIDKKGVYYTKTTDKPFTGISLIHNDDNTIKEIVEYFNGQLFGMNYLLSSQGKIIRESYNLNGKEYKTITQWVRALNSQDGKEYVPASYLYPKDELWYRRSNKKLFTGVAVTYHTNGQPRAEITYLNGWADGPVTIYSHEGKITKEFYHNKEKIPI